MNGKLSAGSKEGSTVGDQIEHVGDSDYRLTFKVASRLFFQFSEMQGQHHWQRMVHGRSRVVAAPRGRIQFDFNFNSIRYRPSIQRPPSEANLRRARERLEAIKHQIRLGTFSFEEEFPDYRFVRRLSGTPSARLCSDVFDAYLVHCEARLRRNDMAAQQSGRIGRSLMAFGALISAT